MPDFDKGPAHRRRRRPPEPEAEAQPKVPVLGGARRHPPRRVQQPADGAAELRLDDAEPQVPLGGAEQDRVPAAGVDRGGDAAQEEERRARKGVSESPAAAGH